MLEGPREIRSDDLVKGWIIADGAEDTGAIGRLVVESDEVDDRAKGHRLDGRAGVGIWTRLRPG
jgi:hypothetical protein